MSESYPSVGVLGIPFDRYSSFLRGPAEGPSRIRAQLFSGASSLWSEGGIDLSEVIQDLDDVVTDGDDPHDVIEAGVAVALENWDRLILLGGDHSITYPILKSFARNYENLSVLHIDAHPDLYDEFGGNRLSHACPFARIMEDGLCRRLVQVGIRNANAHLREQAERFSVEMIEMKDFRSDLVTDFEGPVYLSIDLDGLDPAFAPGVSHPEPGGLSSRELISLIQRSKLRLVGADIVELNPSRDVGELTATLAAKLLKEIAGKMTE